MGDGVVCFSGRHDALYWATRAQKGDGPVSARALLRLRQFLFFLGCPKSPLMRWLKGFQVKSAMCVGLWVGLAAWSVYADGVSVSGAVFFEGKRPVPPIIDTKSDKYCRDIHKDTPLRFDGAAIGPKGEFEWIFVWIDNPPEGEYAPPEARVPLNQYQCRYTQPVMAMMAGQTLEFHNSDDTTHNVRGFPKNNRIFNFGQPPGLAPRTRTIENAEFPLKIKCDIHNWMKSFCFVMDHPFFAVTKADGTFKIAGLSPGTYRLKTWHEHMGEMEQEITVRRGPLSDVKFTYRRAPKK